MDGRGIAGACVSAFSARIGDGRSLFEDGYVSVVNRTAGDLGCQVGMSCREAATILAAAARRAGAAT